MLVFISNWHESPSRLLNPCLPGSSLPRSSLSSSFAVLSRSSWSKNIKELFSASHFLFQVFSGAITLAVTPTSSSATYPLSVLQPSSSQMSDLSTSTLMSNLLPLTLTTALRLTTYEVTAGCALALWSHFQKMDPSLFSHLPQTSSHLSLLLHSPSLPSLPVIWSQQWLILQMIYQMTRQHIRYYR